jgi:hypothetical protein
MITNLQSLPTWKDLDLSDPTAKYLQITAANYGYVNTCARIIGGYDNGNVGQRDNIKRNQVAKIVSLAINHTGYDKSCGNSLIENLIRFVK